MITEQQFKVFEKLRVSGTVNMADLTKVKKLTGLAKRKILEIMDNYPELYQKYTKGQK